MPYSSIEDIIHRMRIASSNITCGGLGSIILAWTKTVPDTALA